MGNISTLTGKQESDLLFADYLRSAVLEGDKVKEAQVRAVLQSFISSPAKKSKQIIDKYIQAFNAKVQAFGVSTDFAQLPRGYFNITTESDNFDLGYELAFQQVPKDANQPSWTIYNVVNGITVKKIPEGGTIKVDNLTGDYIEASVDYYGGAIGFTDRMIRYRQVAAMVGVAEAFRNKQFANKADAHYALLVAAAALNVTTYQGVVADGELQRDIKTINASCYALGNRLKDSGYGDMARVKYILYYNPINAGRILAALSATTGMIASSGRSGEIVNYNITPYPTFNSSVTANYPIVVVPGNKIQRAEDLSPTMYDAPLDALTLNRVTAVWSIWGAIVGDSGQCQQANLV
jgi:hypothetical protein